MSTSTQIQALAHVQALQQVALVAVLRSLPADAAQLAADRLAEAVAAMPPPATSELDELGAAWLVDLLREARQA
jgi:hypothetical protein